jgi:hypothetical protein
MTTTTVCASCDHSSAWHKPGGCAYPGCNCGIAGDGVPLPKRQRITRCSACRRRPDKWGGNHAVLCPRWGQPPDAMEGR